MLYALWRIDWDYKLLTGIARAVMWRLNVSVLNEEPFRFILSWTVAVIVSVNLKYIQHLHIKLLNFRAIHYIYISTDAWSMFYISLIWCYCDILKTSSKNQLDLIVSNFGL